MLFQVRPNSIIILHEYNDLSTFLRIKTYFLADRKKQKTETTLFCTQNKKKVMLGFKHLLVREKHANSTA